ncbi:MAG TPA: hypothetical protein ENH32_08440 [Proteobacteria bacterium]|nr:hypothetical protein BMS3Abin14_01899 [bacterium BMS3Abin14]HDL53988.1 hypothetical protein [Pseudomonadota bacterium]
MNKVVGTLIAGVMCVTLILILSNQLPSYIGQKSVLKKKEGTSESHALNQQGVGFLKKGKFQKAVEKFRAAGAMDPKDLVIAHNLSLGLARLSKVNGNSAGSRRSEALLKEALNLWPENPEALNSLSFRYYEDGRYRDAWNLAVRLAAFNPDLPHLSDYIARLKGLMEEDKGMVAEEGQYFRLLYSGARQLEFEGELLFILQEQMDSLTAALGIFPSHPIDVLLMTKDLGEKAKPVDPVFKGIYDGRIRLYPGDSLNDREMWTGTVRHEMVHALLHQAGGILPAWFQEGVAQKLGERPSAGKALEMKRALRNAMEGVFTPDLLSYGDSFVSLPADERNLAYADSYLFIEYLEGKYGENMIPVIVSDLQQGLTLEEAMRAFTKKDISDLQADFIKDLQKEG